MKLLLQILFLSSILCLMACGDEENDQLACPESVSVIIQDFTGLDGCGWVMTSDAITRTLEPINLLEFVSNPVEGQQIDIEYLVRTDLASICLVGDIVEITCLEL